MAHSLPARAFVALPLAALLACVDGDVSHDREQPRDRSRDAAIDGTKRADASVDARVNQRDAAAAQPGGDPIADLAPRVADQAAYRALRSQVESSSKLDADGVRAAYPSRFVSGLSYDPTKAEFLDRIQGSALALTDGELAALGKNGFMISQRREFPTFLRGLAEIYASHLPLYITADTLLEAVHSSYDQILRSVESTMLVPELRSLLTGMRKRLPNSHARSETRADADLYLTVALSLLEGTPVAPAAGASKEQVDKITKLANNAQGTTDLTLFGVKRTEEDFSQFKPRGHYESSPELQRYFRASMWLGRVDLRLLETQRDGTQLFRREQYLAMLLMHELVGEDLASFERIDATIRTLVGESDYMVLPEVEKLVADLGGAEAARAADDAAVARAIVAGGYGAQQISSHIVVNETSDTLPLSRSFALLGQRYVVDAHVLSEVVYDRLQSKRMMPSALDAAFAALGNAQALALHPELDQFADLPGALARTRVLVDSHDQSFWDANLYNLWMQALRGLSPAADLSNPGASGLPQVAGSEAWGRRLLNTQLGSWAELRHDTLLYAKQSYSGVPACDFPDAYVDPYPQVFRALERYAAAGSRIADLVVERDAGLGARISSYFAVLGATVSRLADMAERELRGEPFTAEQLAFINRAVRVERQSAICTTIDVPDGWYADLFFNRNDTLEFNPTIADIHTQPADEGGNRVGRVLHVGTGYPRMMVTTVDSCQGTPRAYAGVVYAYHEQTTEGFERLTDQTWERRFQTGEERPADVAWLHGVLAK
jgi:hypothetical protein